MTSDLDPAQPRPAEGPRKLAPHLVRAWRGKDQLQIGSSPSTAVVLDGLGPDDRRTLDLLSRGVSMAALDTDARRRGCDPQRRHDLVAALASRRMLVSADAGTTSTEAVRLRAERWSWLVDQSSERSAAARQRPGQAVSVIGGTALATPVAAGFVASGVGTVTVVGEGPVTPADVVVGGPATADVGRPLAAAAHEALARLSARNSPTVRPRGDLMIVIGRDAHDAAATATWIADDVAHLAILIRDCEIVVGPLVSPGRGPCLHCLDLHHRDKDPQWPHLLPQLRRPDPGRPAAVVPGLGQVAAGLAVLMGLGHLDRSPDPTPGTCATVSLPLGEVTWRLWTPHAGCGCIGLDAPAGPGTP